MCKTNVVHIFFGGTPGISSSITRFSSLEELVCEHLSADWVKCISKYIDIVNSFKLTDFSTSSTPLSCITLWLVSVYNDSSENCCA